MKTFKTHPYIWTTTIIALTWLPEVTENPPLAGVIVLILGFPIILNYFCRTEYPLCKEPAFKTTLEKHFNSILIATVGSSILTKIGILCHINNSALLLFIPFLWQVISLPDAGFMLPNNKREMDAIYKEQRENFLDNAEAEHRANGLSKQEAKERALADWHVYGEESQDLNIPSTFLK